MDEPSLRKFCGQLSIRLSAYKTTQGWIAASCPLATWFHASKRDSTPSFAVHVNSSGYSAYMCQTCKNHGTINKLAFQLAHHREDKSLLEVAHAIQLAEIVGFNPPDWEEQPQTTTKQAIINKDIYPPAIQDIWSMSYLRFRGIAVGTIVSLGLRCDPERGRVLFPVYDKQRKFRGYSGRAIELSNIPHSLYSSWATNEKGERVKIRDYFGLPKRALLLGEHDVRRKRIGDRIILVEGLFAYARLRQLGFKNVVALLGSALTPEKAQTLLEWDMPVICLTDNDLAGQEAIYGKHNQDIDIDGIVDLLYPVVPLLIPEWPAGKDDPDQLLTIEAKRMFQQAELYTQ